MADQFSFTKNVPSVGRASKLPVQERQVAAQPVSTPEFQGAFQALAESQNSMSAIGAQVAQSANNAMAAQLGTQQGLNPKGDLMPSLTEFDKHFADSYHAQAQATLTTQAEKLLTDTHIEMSKKTRLNPGLIKSTHAQLQLGLNKIADMAPTAIKGKLKESFDSNILHQITQYNEKMLRDDREDQKNNLINAMDLNIKNALELATSADDKGSSTAIASVHKMADNALANKLITPEQARIYKETAIQSALDGKYSNLAQQSLKNGTYPEFQKKYAENKPEGMTNEQWINTGVAFHKQVGFLETLRSQDEELRAQKMLHAIEMYPGAISGAQFKTFESNVSPIIAEKVKFKYIQALKNLQTENSTEDFLIRNYSNPEAHANTTEKVQNAAFNKKVLYAVESTKNTAAPLTPEMAQVQVAAMAGAPIPVFTRDLKNKINSANPAYIESAAQQIHALREMGAGKALSGLTTEDNALYSLYESLRASRDPITAAREATDIVHNQDPAVQQMNKQKFSNYVTAQASGTPLAEFALDKVKLSKKSFSNLSMAQVYGTEILKVFEANFTITNGNTELATKLTKNYVDENFGQTGINGGSQTTLHPIESMLGFKSKDAVPYIQNDIINQVNEKLLPIKELYQKKISNEYWETVPISGKSSSAFGFSYDPVKIKRHSREINKDGIEREKVSTYELVLHGNNFDSYDVAILTSNGLRNINQYAPYLGITTYRPNSKFIIDNYNKDHNFDQNKSKHINPFIIRP